MRTAVSLLLAFWILSIPVLVHADEPGKLEYRGAEKRLEDLEKKVKRMRGQVFRLTSMDKEFLERLWTLKEK